MGFLRRLFRSDGGGDAATQGTDAPIIEERQSVAVWIRLFDPAFENEREQARLFTLEDRMMRALEVSGAGEHDTNDLEVGYLAIRCLGDDADQVLAVLRPLLAELPAGSYVAVRRGPEGTGEERLDLL